MQALLIWVVVVLLFGGAIAAPSDPELAAMENALKYLQKLDRYYSQVSRPRFGKRVELSPGSEENMHEENADNLWHHLVRRR